MVKQETSVYEPFDPSPPHAVSATLHDEAQFDTESGDNVGSNGDLTDGSPTWWRRISLEYRLVEFAWTVVLLGVALVFSLIKVNERPIPAIRVRLNSTMTVWALDPSLDRVKLTEEVPMWAVIAGGLVLPIATNLIVNYVLPKFCSVRVIAHDTRDFLLTLFQSMAVAVFFTQFTKNLTGRFRPSFYDMCKWNRDVVWDGVTNLCTDAAGEKQGRMSFPSGHTSFAWSTMLVLTLYLLGRSRLNRESPGGKKTLLMFLCCAPIVLAAWVAMTRCIDNWHHYSDIVAAAIIGAVSAVFAVNYNYGSILCGETAGLPLEEIHKRRMATRDATTCRSFPGNNEAFDDQLKQCDCVIDLSGRGTVA